jgi:protein-disulfide isomerase
VNKHLLAVGLEKDRKKTMDVFSGWFEKGKPEGEKFFEPLDTRITDPAVEAEFAKHRAWRERTGIRATPTLLVNGWLLPENYRLEHLRYFTDLDVNYD